MKYITLVTFLVTQFIVSAAQPSIDREAVAVLYNSNLPESKELADYYAKQRQIPVENLIGLPMSSKGKISRKEYVETIEEPLRKHFEQKRWWRLEVSGRSNTIATRNKIQLMVTMYGVPYGVNQDASVKLPDGVVPNALNKLNCASVDSELAVLSIKGIPLYQTVINKYFRKNTRISSAGLPHYMLVGRIDASSLATCKRMIDDAVATEKTGLWGMSYLDLAKKGAGHAIGDQWIDKINEKNWQLGIPTTIDKHRDTYLTNYPLKDVAMYFGWYTTHVNGPFKKADFKFKRGAVAVHLHSFSASKLRNPKAHWVGPLIEKGAAATVGNVYEPYLQGSHHFDILHERLIQGYTFVEAAYMAIPWLSWQNVVIGDPLYQPYKYLGGSGSITTDDKFYRACAAAFSAWSDDMPKLITKLRSAGHKLNDARYFEVAGLIRKHQAKPKEASLFFASAEKMYLLDSDKIRNTLHVIDLLVEAGQKDQAILACKNVLAKFQGAPAALAVQARLNILSPPPPPPAKPNKEISAK